MSFNVRITFTGICAFVSNVDPHGSIRMCVILPDATRLDQTALDDSWLKPHSGFISFDLQNLLGSTSYSGEAKFLKRLYKNRVEFDIYGGKYEYDFNLNGIP